jgi:ppGpp synthetase/RelA/SpoT-type nucleotidyltranferase
MERSKPVRGLSLGLRFAITSILSVTLLVGTLAFLQQRRQIALERASRITLLEESLAPLAADIENADSLADVRKHLEAFRRECKTRGYTGFHVDLLDQTGNLVASSSDDRESNSASSRHSDNTLHASLPITSNLFPGGRCSLAVFRNDASLEDEISQHWRHLYIDALAMVACVLASLILANYFLVSRPLRRLREGVRMMGRGYLGALKSIEGAREWRELAQSIWILGTELEQTVRCLVEAERTCLSNPGPASQDCASNNGCLTDSANTPEALSTTSRDSSPPQQELLLRYLYDKCHLLETQDSRDPVVRAYAKEVWEHDVAEAERLGDLPLRTRLDDAAFRILLPSEYRAVSDYFASMVESPPTWLHAREAEIRTALEEGQVPIVAIERRTKHAGGIWRKMRALNLPADQIQDVFGLRVIVETEDQCYQALALLHRRFRPQLLSFKDYISQPKPNGYRSLHTHLYAQDGPVFEVQIRTLEMHRQASDGKVAHWSYKSEQWEESPDEKDAGSARQRVKAMLKRLH